MELAALMVCLVVLIAVLIGIALWYGDRQQSTMLLMCHVIDELHATCPLRGGRPADHIVVAGETIPQQTRQEPIALLWAAFGKDPR